MQRRVIALLVLLLGVRPLVKSMTKKKDDETKALPMGAADGEGGENAAAPAGPDGIAVQPPVTLEQIEATRNFDERIGAVRGFTRDNPARAALAVRDMIKAEAN